MEEKKQSRILVVVFVFCKTVVEAIFCFSFFYFLVLRSLKLCVCYKIYWQSYFGSSYCGTAPVDLKINLYDMFVPRNLPLSRFHGEIVS